MSSNRAVCSRQRLKRVGEPPMGGPLRRVEPRTMILSGSGAATGFNKTRLTTEKMAVLAPMPRVRAARAVRVKEGLRRKVRREWRRSARKDIVLRLDEVAGELSFACRLGFARRYCIRRQIAAKLDRMLLG